MRRQSVCRLAGAFFCKLERLLDFRGRLFVEQGDHDDHNKADEEGGQKLIERTLAKAEEAYSFLESSGLCCDIEMDGGITEANAAQVIAAGVNILVAGNTVFSAKDMAATIRRLKNA